MPQPSANTKDRVSWTTLNGCLVADMWMSEKVGLKLKYSYEDS
jgi:hypothetical protein